MRPNLPGRVDGARGEEEGGHDGQTYEKDTRAPPAQQTFTEAGAGTAPGFVSAYANSPDIVVRSFNAAGTQADGGVSLVIPLVDGTGAGVGGSG